jgi:hypothetical protein
VRQGAERSVVLTPNGARTFPSAAVPFARSPRQTRRALRFGTHCGQECPRSVKQAHCSALMAPRLRYDFTFDQFHTVAVIVLDAECLSIVVPRGHIFTPPPKPF